MGKPVLRRSAALLTSVGISLGTYGLMGAAGVASAQTGGLATSKAATHTTRHQTHTPLAPASHAKHTSHAAATPGRTPRAALRATPMLAATYAHTYTVNSTGDTADKTPGNGACADTSGKCTLRAAIQEADADTGASLINVPSGYTIKLTAGALDPITNSVQIDATGATVNGNGAEVLDITYPGSGPAPAVGVTGLKITGDVSSDSEGAVYVGDGALTLSGVTISGNDITSGTGWGAAIYNDYYGSLWLVGSTISGNKANYAAGIYNDGAAYISGSTISSNTATDYAGGLYNDGNVIMENTAVSGNHVTTVDGDSAGIYSDEILQVTGGSIDHNVIDNTGYGAGLYNGYIANLTGTSVSDNAIKEGTGTYESDGAGIYDDGEALNLTGVTLNGNSTTMTNGEDIYGTAVYYDGSSLRMANSTISNTTSNGATGDSYVEGGALEIYYGSHASLSDVSISNTVNKAGTNDIYGGAISAEDSVDMTGVTIKGTSNSADYIGGGAVFTYYYDTNSSASGLKISNTTNHASYSEYGEIDGGALYIEAYLPLNNVSIDGTNNLADLGSATTPSTTETQIYGGAIYDEGYEKTWSTVSITNTTSKAVGGDGYIEGGVVYNDEGLNVTDTQVVGATVQADNAIEGGAIVNWDQFQADRLTVANVKATVLGGPDAGTTYLEGASLYDYYLSSFVNSTVANVTGSAPSTASELWGLYNDDESTMTNVTMANNALAGPKGNTVWLYNDSDYETKLANSIVSSTTPAANCGGTGTIVDAGYNIDNGHSCGFTNAGDQQNTNPMVASVADNGGPVRTAALLTGSPAINAGNNNACPATDARGVPRPVGGACDIGAYEYNLQGYWFAASDGGVFSFGPGAKFHGSLGGIPLAAPIVGMASDPATGGYWLVASDGGVFAFDAPYYGSMGGKALNQPIVGITAAPGGQGYWLVARDGGIFAFGPNAHFYGSTGGITLTKPVVGMAADPVTGGYWLVASDGGIFAYHARYFGSMGGQTLAQPVVGMAPAPFGDGYWLVAKDGGIFAFGPTAHFYGSTGGIKLAQPIVGIAPDYVTGGYWMVASDGGVFAFHAPFYGSTGGIKLAQPIVGMAAATVS